MASIKSQIIKKIGELLEPLKQSHGLRVVLRTRSFYLLEERTPAIHYSYGEEAETGKDIKGRKHQFPVYIKIFCDKPDQCDDIVAAVQAIIEGNLQLNGLSITIDGGSEAPFLNPMKVGQNEPNDSGGSIVMYDITYRRRLANPGETY